MNLSIELNCRGGKGGGGKPMARNEGEDNGLKRTPLYEVHRLAGARFISFGGWEMPVQFSGIIDEHLAVRSSVGLFDISHMGEIEVTGPQAWDFLQRTITNDLSRIGDGQAQYTVMCYEDGGIVDDLVVFRISGDSYLLCVNAANAEKDFLWMDQSRRGEVEITDKTMDYALLAVQGPNSQATLQPLVRRDLGQLKRFNFIRDKVSSIDALISRTGYTGEDGFELFFPSRHCPQLWGELLATGSKYNIKPAGLGARDTLRLEMGYSLYGHEISADINPHEAGLGWLVNADKGDFVGRDSLRAVKDRGWEKKLVGLEMAEKGIPRQGHKIFSGEQEVGYITSGTMSPSLKVPVAMGYVSVTAADEGTLLEVEIRARRRRARVVKRPFYRPQA